MTRPAAAVAACVLALGLAADRAAAQVQPRDYCPEDHSGYADGSDLGIVGPLVEGVYTELARGVRVATGVQETPVEVTYDDMRNRLYIGESGGARVELRMVRDGAKPLRWDYSRGEPLDPSAYVNQTMTPAEFGLLAGCVFDRPPQFEWTMSGGGRSAGGLITFLGDTMAVGVKWNSATAARETTLLRPDG
ncbi:hypothetical protein [Histidinibacterium lentulum]|uniref:Uncharacterized protein n=1 Tax=Histidinibacterium lentulum TaxID=2480588 RepID=A0A3N2QV15_9RHOB|nr:hypothetical protein [Histidinibacterium lentulum]ROT99012.1 hypothetical protein EAT49_15405 [Histidinibacterium lentulum]